ncbi:glycosyltransferase family 39 protein [Methanothermobacter sp. DP]|uniref:glycosyltransferase family 39 protein n=1 Tax=Methanothermobacter sp. DP TaxID=2998972 RepID=UPI002AA5297C|nr:glycosyltransferase family 39 protein [Methanothermobacter sp. DP]
MISKTKKMDIIIYTVLLAFTLFMALKLFQLQTDIGIYYMDIFLYVNNAMKMAHLGPGDALYLPPFFPAILSILFRLGFTGERTVFAAAAAFYVLGISGMYLLLRLRFSEMESLAGAISLASFSLILAWAATGALDVPAMALSIWAVYLALLARRHDSRFYYLAFPVSMAAFLTRYTSGLMLLPLAVIILTDPSLRSKLPDIGKGIVLGVLLYIPFGYLFYSYTRTPLPFTKQLSSTVTGSATSLNPGYSTDTLYYLRHLPEYISAIPSPSYYLGVINPSYSGPTVTGFIILAIIAAGLIALIWRNRDLISIHNSERKILFILISAVLIVAFGRLSFALSEVLILIWALSILWMRGETDNIDLNLAMAVWFLAYLYMHSFHPVKVDRYIITVLPPLAYSISLSVNQLSASIRSMRASTILSAAIAILMVSSALHYTAGMPHEDGTVKAEKEAAAWLMDHDPSYRDRVIASDRGPAFTWYMNHYVFTRIIHHQMREMSLRYFYELKPYYYIFSTGKTEIPSGYRVIYSRDGVSIAERIS